MGLATLAETSYHKNTQFTHLHTHFPLKNYKPNNGTEDSDTINCHSIRITLQEKQFWHILPWSFWSCRNSFMKATMEIFITVTHAKERFLPHGMVYIKNIFFSLKRFYFPKKSLELPYYKHWAICQQILLSIQILAIKSGNSN